MVTVSLTRANISRIDLNTYRCKDCGEKWSPTLKSSGRLPKRWWACPNGCNKNVVPPGTILSEDDTRRIMGEEDYKEMIAENLEADLNLARNNPARMIKMTYNPNSSVVVCLISGCGEYTERDGRDMRNGKDFYAQKWMRHHLHQTHGLDTRHAQWLDLLKMTANLSMKV